MPRVQGTVGEEGGRTKGGGLTWHLPCHGLVFLGGYQVIRKKGPEMKPGMRKGRKEKAIRRLPCHGIGIRAGIRGRGGWGWWPAVRRGRGVLEERGWVILQGGP